jgi:hypothetical protein
MYCINLCLVPRSFYNVRTITLPIHDHRVTYVYVGNKLGPTGGASANAVRKDTVFGVIDADGS